MMSSSESLGPPVSSDIPEHTVVLLLEGGQRFLAKAEEAIQQQDPVLRDYYLKRVLAILLELSKRLNQDQGGELVSNLIRIYDWWGRVILDASEQNDVVRLKCVSSQMGEIRRSWEQVLFRGQGMSENP